MSEAPWKKRQVMEYFGIRYRGTVDRMVADGLLHPTDLNPKGQLRVLRFDPEEVRALASARKDGTHETK